jgi:hypothetical protein
MSTVSIGLLMFLAGCGNKNPDSVKQQADNNVKAAGNPAIQNASYATSCTSGSLNFAGLKFPGAKTDYDLSDLNFTKKQLYYSDDCKTSAFFVQEKGKVNVIAKSGHIANALEEDFNFEHTTVTITNEPMVKAFNLVNACGFTDWAPNVEKDVSSQANLILCPGKYSPRTAHEIVLIENTNMFMGANTNQEPSKSRPVELDRYHIFKKQ